MNDEEASKPERGDRGSTGQPKHKALHRVEAHEAVPVIGRPEQKKGCGNECEIRERAGDVFGEESYFILGASRGLHEASAAGAEDCRWRHLKGAIGTGDRIGSRFGHRARGIAETAADEMGRAIHLASSILH